MLFSIIDHGLLCDITTFSLVKITEDNKNTQSDTFVANE